LTGEALQRIVQPIMSDDSRLGNFDLLAEIGHGGMGSVYRAFDPALNREVAIKVLNPNLAAQSHFVTEFLQEARNAAAISHPHIVQVHQVGEERGYYFIVMELLKGRSFEDIVKADGPLPEESALEWTIQVAEALKAAYQNNMIHGDIKPANIFVTEHGAKALDFGLSKLANLEAPAEGVIWGSAYYMSPERVGRRAEDFRSDIYSLGATLFDVLTGRPPFDAADQVELAMKRLNEKPPLLRAIRPGLTKTTEQVVNKMLSKSPLTRYRDYDHLIEQLNEAKTAATAARLGVSLKPGAAAPKPAATAKRSSPLIIVVAAIAIGAVIYVATRKKEPAPPPVTTTQTAPTTPVVVTQKVVVTPPTPVTSTATPAAPTTAQPSTPRATPEEEKEKAQALETEIQPLIRAYDFAGARAKLAAADKQLTTPDGHQALKRPLLTTKYLADFKTQLSADFVATAYGGAALWTKTRTALDGKPLRATDAGIATATQYGEVVTRWEDLDPDALRVAAEYYLAFARNDPLDAQAARRLALATYAYRFGLSASFAAHALAAIQCDPSAEATVKTLFGAVPKPPPAPKPVATQQPKPATPKPTPAPAPKPMKPYFK
jgi:serine/threonine-protein kinase